MSEFFAQAVPEASDKCIAAWKREYEIIRTMHGRRMTAGEISRESGYPLETVRRTLKDFSKYGTAANERIDYLNTVVWWLEEEPEKTPNFGNWRKHLETAKADPIHWRAA